MKIIILGSDGAGKSSVIRGLINRFDHRGLVVKMRHLKPRLVMSRRGDGVTIVVDPHGKPPRSAFTSTVKILIWLMEEWFAHLFQDQKDTLLICDRYYHDLLVDPKRYRYGGPAWAAKCIGELMPQPDLWVLLDAPAEVLQARKREVPREESARQREAYRAFIRTQDNSVMVDAAQPMDQVIAEAYQVIEKQLTAGLARRE